MGYAVDWIGLTRSRIDYDDGGGWNAEESSFKLDLFVDVVSMDLLCADDGVSQVFRVEVGGCWCLVGVRAVLKMRRARRISDCRVAKERGLSSSRQQGKRMSSVCRKRTDWARQAR